MEYVSLILFLGLFLKASGFLVRDELLLRVLVATGMFCDILFYMLQPTPLWESVVSNALLASINIMLVVFITFERTTINMSDEDRVLFASFPTLSPGQFRRIMKHATWHSTDDDLQLAKEGQPLNKLYFVDTPTFEIEKLGKRFTARGPAFVGELAFLNGKASTAHVWVRSGARYVVFDSAKLRYEMARSGPLNNAMIALFGQDLAQKVAVSAPIEGLYQPDAEGLG